MLSSDDPVKLMTRNAVWHHKSFKPNARPCISHGINQYHQQKYKGYLCSHMLDRLTFHVRFDRSACYLVLCSQYGNTTFNVRRNERTDKHPSLSGCLLKYTQTLHRLLWLIQSIFIISLILWHCAYINNDARHPKPACTETWNKKGQEQDEKKVLKK